MAKWFPDSTLGLRLDEVEKSDEEVVCNQQPATYFNCAYPDLWIPSDSIVVGDLRRPPTYNGFIYEALDAGTTGGTEPGWGTTQDQEFEDNGITWKTHENYALANTPLTAGQKTRADGDPDGLALTIAQIVGVTVHTNGTVSHTALIENATQKLHVVTTASTTTVGNNDVESGKLTIFHAFTITDRDPQ